MSILEAIVVGLVQGIAEFLPISSSGHLAVIHRLFRFGSDMQSDMFFDVLLHLGTLIAVFMFYWKDIRAMILEFFTILHLRRRPEGEPDDPMSRRLILFIIFGTLPVLLGYFVKDSFEALSSNLYFIAVSFLITGCLLYLGEQFGSGRKNLRNATLRDVLLVGVGQLCAVCPGLSRSGTTISVGRFCGFERSFAVRYSFLLSIPAVFGANILSFADAIRTGIDVSRIPAYLIGLVIATVSGYCSIQILHRIARKKNFNGFAVYCWGAALVTLLLALTN